MILKNFISITWLLKDINMILKIKQLEKEK